MNKNHTWKKFSVFILVALLLCNICNIPAQASSDDIKVYVNGHKLIFDDPPVIQNDRTLVPLRAIFEAMGVPVYWDDNSNTVIAIKDDVKIKLTIGSATPTINGKQYRIDAPPRIINGRTFVPLRFISDALGSDIDWFGNSRTIMVNSHNNINIKNVNNRSMKVHIFNGCEDLAMLIIASYDGEEETTLIVTGKCSDARDIINKLDDNGVHIIDRLIVTRPFIEDSDGISEIYANFRVEDTILSYENNTSDAYEEFMQENYPAFPLKPEIPDLSQVIPDVSKLIPDISKLIPDLSNLW